MDDKQDKLNHYNSSSAGVQNGHLFGLPFDEQESEVVIVPVPWDVTASYRRGTAKAFDAILEVSVQLDLYDVDQGDAWQRGIFLQTPLSHLVNDNQEYSELAKEVIAYLENGGKFSCSNSMQNKCRVINIACTQMVEAVYLQCRKLLAQGKMVGILGGDHSTSLGYMKALSEHSGNYGILQIDAHADLRKSYEGFEYSHASIMYNALKNDKIERLVQVGIRDICREEVDYITQSKGRVQCFYDRRLKEAQYRGATWMKLCEDIVETLPQQVYISFDIDGLDPKLSLNTGTPVAGGLEMEQVFYLLKHIKQSGRKIIGFDLCEVGDAEWDANVGARVLYKLAIMIEHS